MKNAQRNASVDQAKREAKGGMPAVSFHRSAITTEARSRSQSMWGESVQY